MQLFPDGLLLPTVHIYRLLVWYCIAQLMSDVWVSTDTVSDTLHLYLLPLYHNYSTSDSSVLSLSPSPAYLSFVRDSIILLHSLDSIDSIVSCCITHVYSVFVCGVCVFLVLTLVLLSVPFLWSGSRTHFHSCTF